MRPIQLEHSDYDVMNGETWVETRAGYLLTDRIVLDRSDIGIWLYCYDEDIAIDATTAIAKQATIIALNIDGASVENIDHSVLSHMSLVNLAEFLAGQL